MGEFDLKRQIQTTGGFEGLRLFPYRCPAGKLTIGYGRNLEERGISRPEAEALLENDLLDAYEVASKYSWFPALSTDRKLVIVDMIFNLGANGFSKFARMHEALELHDYDWAAKEMLDSRWATQVGRRSRILASLMSSK
jgi:lysozyme